MVEKEIIKETLPESEEFVSQIFWVYNEFEKKSNYADSKKLKIPGLQIAPVKIIITLTDDKKQKLKSLTLELLRI